MKQYLGWYSCHNEQFQHLGISQIISSMQHPSKQHGMFPVSTSVEMMNNGLNDFWQWIIPVIGQGTLLQL